KEQADLNAASLGLDGPDNDGSVKLGADADADNAKVHQSQRPKSPVEQDEAKVLEVPRAGMVDAPEVVVVYNGLLAGQSLRRWREPLPETTALSHLARDKGTVGQPPQEDEAEDNGDQAVDQEHPAKADQAPKTIHELEASGHKSDHSSRDLGCGIVHTDP